MNVTSINRNRVLIGSLLVLLERIWFVLQHRLAVEDAYITFHGAIDPQWIRASTSPTWTLILRFLHEMFGFDPATASRVILFSLDMLVIWSVRKLKPVQFWAFVALWMMPFIINSSTGGLETHIIGCMAIVACNHPRLWSLVSVWRIDFMAASLIASGRKWMWAVPGIVVSLVLNLFLFHSPLPQTVTSKAAVYGIHLFHGWQWFWPMGIGPLYSVLFLLAMTQKSRLVPLAFFSVTVIHWIANTPQFWWYAMPGYAVLAYFAAQSLRDRRWVVALAVLMLASIPYQWIDMTGRIRREESMWPLGQIMAKQITFPATILLEPAGMIPYLNPNLNVYDTVGLVNPWVADRMKQGDGWMTDAIQTLKPEIIVLRVYEYVWPRTRLMHGAGNAFRTMDERESVMRNYVPVYSQGMDDPESPEAQSVEWRTNQLLVLLRTDIAGPARIKFTSSVNGVPIHVTDNP